MRRGYIDWLRGVAVLIMIEAHTIDSWTRAADRSSPLYGRAMILGGFGAPLFLFLAGVAVALAAGARFRKGAAPGDAAAGVRRRGWQIFFFAFLFRLQAYVLSGSGNLKSLLKVDILNIMGPSIVMAASLWGRVSTMRARVLVYASVTVLIAMLTPLVRATPLLDWLPDPIEWYLRPSPGWTNFTLFPWAGFVFAGAAVGVLLDHVRDASNERRLQVALAVAGLLLATGGYAASYLPAIYAKTNFWTSSPTFFFLRTGVLVLAVPIAYLWGQHVFPARWSPLQYFGQHSLFVYWIHVEMVYGVPSRSIHKTLSFPMAIAALAAFTLFLFGLCLIKDWLAERLKRDRS